MMDLYKNSWLLYKKQSESFLDDLNYYYKFSEGYKTLDIFAGYGRLTNYLYKKGVEIEAVEINPNFANFISIPSNKVHVENILEYRGSQFDRIIAGYNSFCLLNEEKDIISFFKKLDHILKIGGKASLSYFPFEYWGDAPSGKIEYNGEEVTFESSYTKLSNDRAIWYDKYFFDNGKSQIHEYKVKLYSSEYMKEYLKGTNLKIVEEVRDFNLPLNEISETGWIDYVLQKGD